MRQTMDALATKAPHFLLQQGTHPVPALSTYKCVDNAYYFCVSDILEYYLHCEQLNTPSEFIERYTKPTHITLDSGTYKFLGCSAVVS